MKYQRKYIGKVLIAGLMGLIVTGCAGFRNLGGGGKFEPPVTGEWIVSRVDSIASSGLLADTIMLGPGEEYANYPGGRAMLTGPASVEAGYRASVPGYRIQLASSEERREIERLVQRVERELESKTYIERYSGRFCLRVGDFEDRAEAETLRVRAVAYGFRFAWVVQDSVFPER